MLNYDVAELKRPIQTEPENTPCGDSTWVYEDDQQIMLVLFDGAGHGILAYRIAQRAMYFTQQNRDYPLRQLLILLHEHLRGTEGGVIAICKVCKTTGVTECTGVGNVFIRLFSKEKKQILIRGGILGYENVSPKVEQQRLVENDILILYSDGVRSSLDITEIPEFQTRGARDLARIIIDYHSKVLDDASVIVLKVAYD